MRVWMSTLALVILGPTVMAQVPPKKVITHRDYEIWNSESGMTLSRDGQWIAYILTPPEGDRFLVIRSTANSTEYRIPTGGRAATAEGETPAAPPTTAPGTPPIGPRPGGGGTTFISGGISFLPNNKQLVTVIQPTKADVEKAKENKDAAKSFIAVIELSSGKIVERITGMKAFRVIDDEPGYLILHHEAKPETPPPAAKTEEKPKETAPPPKPKPDDADDDQPPAGGGRGLGQGQGRRPGGQPGTTPGTGTPTPTPRRTYGTELTVRNLTTGKAQVFSDVVDYVVAKDAKHLVATTSKKDSDNTVSFAALNGSDTLKVIRTGKQRYSRLTWNSKQTQLAFFADELPAEKKDESTPPSPATPKPPTVYLWDRGAKEAVPVITPETTGLKAGHRMSDRSLSFSTDGNRLLLTAVPNPVEPPKSTIAAADKVDLDLWHWKDEKIQPMQKVQAGIDRNKSYAAMFDLPTKKLIQLSDEEKTVTPPRSGVWTVSSDDRKYRYLTGYGATLRDYDVTNVLTGETKSIVKASPYPVALSPDGSKATWFDGKHWWVKIISSNEDINLTAKVPSTFFDDEIDTPSEPQPYGFPIWTSDKQSVVLYDKHDAWLVSLRNVPPVKLTALRKSDGIRFRILRIDLADDLGEEPTPGIDLSKPQLLAATNLNTMDSGFYRLEPKAEPKLLVMAARSFGSPVKAKNADVMLVRSQTFYDPNDYYVTDSQFRELKKVTDLNPKVREFNWGKAELVHYQNDDGVKLKGVLIKPENFDPNKQYPMIVYIYEKLSNTVHGFRLPSAGTSINPTYYASNGYLVFMPDIVYNIGSPGQSALKCVLPAIQAVVNQGIVKEDAIGIQGHSWGGYQIAYMVTQTNRFKAASAGAPVSNMVSAYGGIRWGSGLPREFQYERTQSRIGATLWAAQNKFIENSPVFYADRVKTPLMMLHNDQDDAVPWYQGIEYYLALRRLGKEVYMFNYNGEFHGLRKKATQRDYTLRMQQFFDHHLKGSPMPEWMEKGIPYLDRDTEKEKWKNVFVPEKK